MIASPASDHHNGCWMQEVNAFIFIPREAKDASPREIMQMAGIVTQAKGITLPLCIHQDYNLSLVDHEYI